MTQRPIKYRALISSDWNECLAPSGPFDVISFNYPSLDMDIKKIFEAYTGNRIHLSEATRRIVDLTSHHGNSTVRLADLVFFSASTL